MTHPSPTSILQPSSDIFLSLSEQYSTSPAIIESQLHFSESHTPSSPPNQYLLLSSIPSPIVDKSRKLHQVLNILPTDSYAESYAYDELDDMPLIYWSQKRPLLGS